MVRKRVFIEPHELLKTDDDVEGAMDELQDELELRSSAIQTIRRERRVELETPLRKLAGSVHMMNQKQLRRYRGLLLVADQEEYKV